MPEGVRVAPCLTDYLIFSLRILPTLAFNDLQPVGAGRWLSAIEGILGVTLFALFVFTLGRRVSGY